MSIGGREREGEGRGRVGERVGVRGGRVGREWEGGRRKTFVFEAKITFVIFFIKRKRTSL